MASSTKSITKSSRHSVLFSNIGKQNMLTDFLEEYNRMVWWFVDYLWENRLEIKSKNKTYIFDIKKNYLVVPSFISTVGIDYTSDLSARAIKLASGEALDIVKSRIQKRKQQLYVLAKLMKDGRELDFKKLQSKIDSKPLTKPTRTNRLSAMLDSNCCKFIEQKTKEFDGFLKIFSIGKKYGHIYIPIKFTKHTLNLNKKGYKLITSWTITRKTINSIWQREATSNNGTVVLGADQGMTTCLSLSDSQVTNPCIHNHDLASIIKKLSNKKQGSKAFKRAQEHRTNYINWSIKQLNLENVKEIRLEKLRNVRRCKSSSKDLSHWTYTQINAQIFSICSELGVLVVEQSAVYRSQRCNSCGWTQKSNRKGKEFICRKCGECHDADINGALNHEADLYQLPFNFWQMHYNRKGFYWLESLVYDDNGQDLTVPDV
jgi:transposase